MELSAINRLLNRTPPDTYVPVEAFSDEQNIFYTGDGYVGAVLNVSTMTGGSDEMADKLNTMLRFEFPPNSFVSFLLYASPDIRSHVESITGLREKCSGEVDELLLETKRAEAKFYTSGVNEPIERNNYTKLRDFQCIVSVKIPCRSSGVPSDDDLKLIAELKARVLKSLESLGMVGYAMNAEDYIYFMSTMVNSGERASWKVGKVEHDEDQFISKQIFDLDTDIEIKASTVRIGKKWVRSISPRRLPSMFSLSLVPAYIGDIRTGSRGIRGQFAICLNIFFPDFHKEKSDLEQKRQYVNYQAVGNMLKFVPRIAKQKESFDALFESIEGGDRIVKISPSFFVFGDTEQQAADASINMQTYYSELGLNMQEDQYICMPMFVNAWPLCADKTAVDFSQRYHTVTTKHAAQFIPASSDWKGTGTHQMTFTSRNGQLMAVDLYDSSTNFNAVIAAQSGAGKSFLTNYIIVSYLSTGGRAWVIDVGRSYKKICSILGGDFIEFSPTSELCLNPFPLIKDYDEEADTIIGLLGAMACPTEELLSAYQISRLKEYVRSGWDQYGNDLSIDIIADSLRSDDDERVKDIGHRLNSFTSYGEYGKYFNGVNNVRFENKFTVLELEELKAKPHLQQVVLLQLIYQIQQEMYLGDLSKRKLLIIDEAWQLLLSERIAAFIEGGYRRFRKYNGAAMVITQSLFDLQKDRTGQAIVENSANMMLLGQKRDVITQIQEQKKLDLSPGAFEVLKTVSSIKGVYSEIFFYLDSGRQVGIGRLIVDRFTQLLYTTLASEVAGINERTALGMSTIDAINDYIAWENQQKALGYVN